MVEASTGAIYHASDSVLARLDRLQDRFASEIGLTEKTAFLKFNLAPLCLRRDIAMLGMLHKCVLQQAHPKLNDLFRLAQLPPQRITTRTSAARHDKQLVDIAGSCHLDVVKRSALGLVKVYNLLPQDIVDKRTVKDFQRGLTDMARKLCQADNVFWSTRFSPRQPHHVQLLR